MPVFHITHTVIDVFFYIFMAIDTRQKYRYRMEKNTYLTYIQLLNMTID